MKFIKNQEISDKFNVSFPTVLKWVENKLDKNNLQTSLFNKKLMVLDNPHNLAELQKLAENSRRFRSNINLKKIKPDKRFYEIFNSAQIIEIINDLEIHNSIEYKFTYLDYGTSFWNNFYLNNAPNELYPTPKRVNDLLENIFEYLLYQLGNSQKFNIIDIGPGNGLPVKNLLEKLSKVEKLKKYTSLDISSKMNELANENIKKWFPSLEIQSVVADIEIANFVPIFFENKMYCEKSVNLILYLGGTIGNHKNINLALSNIQKGLGKDDLLLISNTLENQNVQTETNYIETEEARTQDTWIPKMLGFDVSKCQIITQFEGVGVGKTEKLEIDKDYILEIQTGSQTKKLEFIKGQKITLWRHKMSNLDTLPLEFKSCSLQIHQLTALKDLSHAMILCKSI